MSNVIDSFLVALGFEVDEKSVKDTTGAIKGVRTNALAMGAALSAAFLGVNYAATQSAKRIDDVYKSSKLLGGVGVSDLDKYRHAFVLAGGAAEDAESTLSGFESLLANAAIGQGPFEELEKAGIPASLLTDTKTSIELFQKLAKIFPTLTSEQKKLATGALGLNRGADLLLREGGDQINKYLADAEKLGVINDKQAKNAEMLIDAYTRLDRAVEGVMNAFTGEAAVGMAEAINDLADAIAKLQSTGATMGDFFSSFYKEIAAVAGLGSAATVAHVSGKAVEKVGGKTVGKGLTAGAKGIAKAIPVVGVASLWNIDEDIKGFTGLDLKENKYTGWAFRPINEVFGGPVPTDSDISGRGTNNKIENNYKFNNTITVKEAVNGKETAAEVAKEINKATSAATESIKTNVKG